MKHLVQHLAHRGIAALNALFGVDTYAISIAMWERMVLRRARNVSTHDQEGISLFFETKSFDSMAKTGRDFVLKLGEADIPFSVVDIRPPWVGREEIHGKEAEEVGRVCSRKAHYRRAIVFGGPELRPVRGYKISTALFCEFNDVLPIIKPNLFQYGGSVLCFSDFCRNIVLHSAPQGFPVYKIRYPFILPPCRQPEDRKEVRKRIGIPDDSFAVFFNFSLNAVPERKNAIGMAKVFADALGKEKNARLVLKTAASRIHPDRAAALRSAIHALGIEDRTIILEKEMEMEDVLRLTAAMDVYLSLHRVEGLGLGMLESMALGIPVVATGYGGNTEFMNEKTAFVVPFAYHKWEPGCGMPKEMADWGEPDTATAASMLKSIYSEPAEARRKASAGMDFVRDYYSIDQFKKDVAAFMNSQ